MKKIFLFLMLFALMTVQVAFAQNRTVTGTVTSADDGETLPGVSVVMKGTSQGTVTNVDGKYSIQVDGSDVVLIFSYIGMTTQELTVSGNTLDAVMETSSIGVDEVVVTAMGISRERKALGYAATTIGDDELVKSRNTNVTNALSGKVAGLQVQTTSTAPGSASSLVIRGFGSINGSNQPLYIVDGVPLQNTSLTSFGNSVSANGISNLSSNDIASMTVLKGAAATALYGSRASNGVVIITTKTGERGNGRNFSLEYSGGMQFRQVSVLPDFQNDFGQGWNGKQTYIENGSWGPRLDGSQQVYGPIWNGQQLIHPYSAREDNVKDFFDIGISHNHNISFSGISSDNKMNYYLSLSFTDDDGIMPSDADSYARNTIAYRSSYDAADWLKVSSSINFARTETDIVSTFQGASVIDGLYEMARDISIVDMQDLSSPFFTPEAYFTPYGITNPYWSLENNYNHLDSKQIYGKVQVDVKPIESVSLSYRFGYDYTDYDRKIGSPQISLTDEFIDEDYGYAPSNMNQDGYVYAQYRRAYEINNDFLANYDDKFGKIAVGAIAGLNVNERYSTWMSGQTDILTFETGFWDLSNGANRTSLSESQTKRRLVGLFGDVTLGYDEFVFLNLTARNDWSSTLPIGENSYFYPGATLSWLFTEMFESSVITFGKLRLAYGKTGNDASTYLTSTQYVQAYANGYYGSGIADFPMNSTNAFILSTLAGSTSLKPEMTSEAEIGLEMRMFDGRIGIDASYYNRKTDDQIFTLPVDPSTGFSSNVTNFGEVENKGVELLLNLVPVKTRNIRWDLGLNFTKNYNKVLTMPESLDGGRVTINSFAAGNDAVYMYAEADQAMGRFYTYLPQYVDDKSSEFYGHVIVDEYGQLDLTDEVQDTGWDMNHDWIGGVTTSLTAYGFTLSAALDVRKGGYMFSRTKNLMQFTGNGIETTYNDRNPFIIPNSVQIVGGTDDAPEYAVNTSEIKMTDGTMQDYYDAYGYQQGGRAYLIDRSFTKLRNVTLSYDLPRSLVNKVSLAGVSLSAFVNNAFVWTASDNYHIDPESSTEGTDLEGMFGEMYSNPSSRIYGFNLNVKF